MACLWHTIDDLGILLGSDHHNSHTLIPMKRFLASFLMLILTFPFGPEHERGDEGMYLFKEHPL